MLELVTETGVDLATSGARHGWGCFETVRVQEGRARWLERHLERLASGCGFLGLEAPPDADRVAAFLEGATNLSASAKGCLRLFAVDGRLHVRLDPPPPPLALPVAVCLSHAVTRFAASPLNRFKTLSYLENRRLQQEAERQGCFEALALNERGRLTDGGRTTLLVRVRGRWLTPPVEDGALPGIARGLLLEAEVVEEASLHPEELTAADGAALVNALRGVIPVGRGIGLAAWEREPPGIDGLRRILA